QALSLSIGRLGGGREAWRASGESRCATWWRVIEPNLCRGSIVECFSSISFCNPGLQVGRTDSPVENKECRCAFASGHSAQIRDRRQFRASRLLPPKLPPDCVGLRGLDGKPVIRRLAKRQ